MLQVYGVGRGQMFAQCEVIKKDPITRQGAPLNQEKGKRQKDTEIEWK